MGVPRKVKPVSMDSCGRGRATAGFRFFAPQIQGVAKRALRPAASLTQIQHYFGREQAAEGRAWAFARQAREHS